MIFSKFQNIKHTDGYLLILRIEMLYLASSLKLQSIYLGMVSSIHIKCFSKYQGGVANLKILLGNPQDKVYRFNLATSKTRR